VNAEIGGLYVGGFPMMKIKIGFDYVQEIFNGFNFYLNPNIIYNGIHYPHLNINGRNNNSQNLSQPSAIPNYYLMNLHFGFNLNGISSFIKNVDLGVNIYNILNEDYILDAYESVNGDPLLTTSWLGRERWIDVGLSLSF